MCGIAGCFHFESGAVDREILTRMTETLVHRGPDSSGYFFAAGIGLGMRRLSIIDLATGDQPLYSEDGNLVLVCNGEIYNYRQLVAELEAKGHRFHSRSD